MMPTGTRNYLMELLMGQVQAEQRGAEVEERTNMLPLVRYNDGTTGLGVPGGVYGPAQSAYNMLTTDRLNRALMGDDQAMQQSTRDSFDAASLAAVGGLTMPRPANSLGMFGGRMAKTADHAALAKAEDMASRGTPREQIWDETGWFQGVDGKWRFEIDDSGAVPTMPEDASFGYQWAALPDDDDAIMSTFLRHKKLFEAYPALSSESVRALPRSDYNDGWYDRGRGFAFNRGLTAEGDEARRTMLHEAQHAIDAREGFIEPGRYQNITDDMYERGAHEVQARAVETRRDLTPEQRRARAPWLDYDVPESEQIVRFR